MLKQQHQLFVGLLVAADAAVVIFSTLLSLVLRVAIMGPEWLPRSWEHWPKEALALYAVPVALVAFWAQGLYRPRRDRSLLGEVATIVKASFVSMLGILAVAYVFSKSLLFDFGAPEVEPVTFFGITLDAGRFQLALLAGLLPSCMIVERAALRWMLRSLRRRGWNLRHVAVIGVGRLGQIVTHTLERNSWTGIKVAYFLSHQDKTRRTSCMDRPVLGGLEQLEQVMDEHKPDAVYVALPSSRLDQLNVLLSRLQKFPVQVRVVPDITPRYLPQSMAVSELDGMPILSYRECPTMGLGGVTKRTIDVLGSIAGMIFFAPLMLCVAVGVKLSGPGPVIFRQKRVSLGGQVFSIYKFRTMRHVADETGYPRPARWTSRNDPRVTRFGRWLRKTSLDELPQLYNVLRGEMSLVGPRPERPELIERFREDWRGYMLRQHVKAGMTGWAQINGHRGSSSLRKRLQYDLFYIKNWSLRFDLKILVLTLFRGFVHRNAH